MPENNPHNEKKFPIGVALRRAREGYDLTLEDVAFSLNIRSRYLKALEEGDVSALPGKAYAIGFVRSYAEYLDLNAEKSVSMFKEQVSGPASRPTLSFLSPLEDKQVPSLKVIFLSIILFVALIWGWGDYRGREKNDDILVIPDVPIHLKPETLEQKLQEKIDEVSKAVEVAEQKKSEAGLFFEVVEDSWVRIRNDQRKIIYEGIVRTGEKFQIPVGAGYRLLTGNAGGLRVTVNDVVLGILGQRGKVVNNILLEPEALTSMLAPEDSKVEE